MKIQITQEIKITPLQIRLTTITEEQEATQLQIQTRIQQPQIQTIPEVKITLLRDLITIPQVQVITVAVRRTAVAHRVVQAVEAEDLLVAVDEDKSFTFQIKKQNSN